MREKFHQFAYPSDVTPPPVLAQQFDKANITTRTSPVTHCQCPSRELSVAPIHILADVLVLPNLSRSWFCVSKSGIVNRVPPYTSQTRLAEYLEIEECRK